MQRDESDGVQAWLVLLVLLAYWAFVYRSLKRLAIDARDLGKWFRDWRAE
jgi:hypothetical protein